MLVNIIVNPFRNVSSSNVFWQRYKQSFSTWIAASVDESYFAPENLQLVVEEEGNEDREVRR